MARRILIINGPNLNLLGYREPATYGSMTLAALESSATHQSAQLNIEVESFQSNDEGALVDRIHEAGGFGHMIHGPNSEKEHNPVDAIIINPGAFTHTSIAIRDALLGVNLPFIEVHISNVHARESFRHRSYLSDKAAAVIVGMGTFGYTVALQYAANHLKVKEKL